MQTVTGNFSYTRGVKYPIVVAEDTLFLGCNFAQAAPHTAIFDVKPGVAVRFEECNLVNVTVPDGVEIVGGNGRHLVSVPLVGQVKPATNLLCECNKCCTYTAELQARLAAGTCPKDATGRVVHSSLKDGARARRLNSTTLSADRTKAANDNAAAMTKYGRTVTAALQTSVGRGT